MEWIPNQPVFFGTEDACSDDELTIVQLSDNTDTPQVQFTAEPCDDATQLLSDPNFSDPYSWTNSNNWTLGTNVFCLNSAVVDGYVYASVLEFEVAKRYKVTITVDSISAGGSFYVMLGDTVIGTVTSAGTFDFYGFPSAGGIGDGYLGIILYPTVIGMDTCLSYITVTEVLTNAIIAIYNSDGVYQTKISYSANPTYFVFAENTLTVNINWASLGLSNNCYYLCLLDPCVNSNGQNYPASITNCEITGSGTGWTYGSAWKYESNDLVGKYNVSRAEDELSQTEVFDTFTNSYCVEIVLSKMTGTIEVYFGTNLITTLTTVGTHTVTGVATTTGTLFLLLTSGTCTVDSICPCSTNPLYFVCNYQSNTFKLASYTTDCTKLINACNNENGLGFVFNGSGFSPRLRVESKFRQSKYKGERSVYEDSKGKKKVTYFSGRKEKMLCIDLQPEYVHDFLRLLLGFDNVYIDNTLYSVEDDEYNVNYNDASDNIGSVRITVSEQTQNVKNINKSDDENLCNLATATTADVRTIDSGLIRTLSDGTERTLN